MIDKPHNERYNKKDKRDVDSHNETALSDF